MQARIQRIIAERFLPLLDDVFVAHRTHILRTTAYTGGPACIAGVLGSKSIDLGASGQQAFLPSTISKCLAFWLCCCRFSICRENYKISQASCYKILVRPPLD